LAFHLCNKIPDTSNLKEEEFILAGGFRGSTSSWESWIITVLVMVASKRDRECLPPLALLFSLFYSTVSPAYGMVPLILRWAFPP
jgi:hypothetical protein